MSDLGFLLAPALAFAAVTASPGPATLSLVVTAMNRGRGAAAPYGFGLAFSLSAWGVLAALGFGPLLAASATGLVVLKFASALFLSWLAWSSARSALRDDAPKLVAAHEASPLRWFARGAALNGMNPKALVAWAAVIALGLGPETSVTAVWSIWAMCAALAVTINVGYAILFALPAPRRAYRRARRWIEGIAAMLFAAAALRLLFWREIAP